MRIKCLPVCLVAAVILSLLFSPLARARDKDAIDIALDACLATTEGQTTAGMVNCTGSAIGAWDARLNETYQKAMSTLDPHSRALLRTAQRRWLEFRTADQAAMSGPWRSGHGSLMRVQVMAASLSAMKERVAELRLYFAAD